MEKAKKEEKGTWNEIQFLNPPHKKHTGIWSFGEWKWEKKRLFWIDRKRQAFDFFCTVFMKKWKVISNKMDLNFEANRKSTKNTIFIIISWSGFAFISCPDHNTTHQAWWKVDGGYCSRKVQRIAGPGRLEGDARGFEPATSRSRRCTTWPINHLFYFWQALVRSKNRWRRLRSWSLIDDSWWLTHRRHRCS